MSNKIIRTEYGICPVCNGMGRLANSGTTASVYNTCYHCNGTKRVVAAIEEVKPTIKKTK